MTTEAGLVWVVAGVWGARAVWGRPPTVAWGLAVAVAGVRWRTLDLAGLQTSTRLFGPTVGVEPVVAAAGACVALVAALVDEAALDGLRGSPVEQLATGTALVVLVACFAVPGPSSVLTVLWWTAASALAALLVLRGPGLARRVPGWVAPVLAAAGLVAVGLST